MTIHHDKLAYGKLASSMEELTSVELEELIKQLNEEEDGEAAKKQNDEKQNKL